MSVKNGRKRRRKNLSYFGCGANFGGKNVCDIFLGGNLFLRIAGKIAKISKIKTRKNFVPYSS